MKVLNFGSLNLDFVYQVPHFVQAGETLLSVSRETFVGGKGLNQSIALARAGIMVEHAGAVGKDGDMLISYLQQSQVGTKGIWTLEGIPTGHAIIQKDGDGNNCILLLGGANQSMTWEQITAVMEEYREGDYLILQNEINHMPELVELAYEKGMHIVLNPSPMNEVIDQIDFNHIEYMLLNEIEAGQILKTKEQEKELLIKMLTEKFPNMKIVLTLGGDGAIYADAEQMVSQPCYPTEVCDTTAAGDTFTGYFMAGILTGKTVTEAMDQAAKAASITVSRAGAAPSIPYMEEVRS